MASGTDRPKPAAIPVISMTGLISPDMQPASGLVGECSTDLHGNTFTAGTSSEEMSDPGAEYYQRDKGQRNLVSFFSARFRRSGTCPLSLRC